MFRLSIVAACALLSACAGSDGSLHRSGIAELSCRDQVQFAATEDFRRYTAHRISNDLFMSRGLMDFYSRYPDCK